MSAKDVQQELREVLERLPGTRVYRQVVAMEVFVLVPPEAGPPGRSGLLASEEPEVLIRGALLDCQGPVDVIPGASEETELEEWHA